MTRSGETGHKRIRNLLFDFIRLKEKTLVLDSLGNTDNELSGLHKGLYLFGDTARIHRCGRKDQKLSPLRRFL